MPERDKTPTDPFLKMLAGIMPILHSSGVISPGQLGPTRREFDALSFSLTRTISSTGTPSVMHVINSIPASIASSIAAAALAGAHAAMGLRDKLTAKLGRPPTDAVAARALARSRLGRRRDRPRRLRPPRHRASQVHRHACPCARSGANVFAGALGARQPRHLARQAGAAQAQRAGACAWAARREGKQVYYSVASREALAILHTLYGLFCAEETPTASTSRADSTR